MQICGQCTQQFQHEDQYLDHVCPKTGFTPRDPEHLGPEFKAISEAALARGAERAGEEHHPAEVLPPEEPEDTSTPEEVPTKNISEDSLINAVTAAKKKKVKE